MIETLTWFDHVVVAAFTLGLGAHSYFAFKKFLDRLADGEPGLRRKEYLATILIQWALTAAALYAWFIIGNRTATDLGLGWTLSWRMWLGAGLVLAVVVLLAQQVAAVAKSPKAQASVRKQFLPLERLLPQSPVEVRYFAVVSVTAGVCEEILYRGYLLAYLSVWLPVWLAALLAVVAFGLAHSYQSLLTGGPGGILKTAAFGGVAMLLYLLTESLWCSILLHIAVDLQAGGLANQVYVKHPRAAGDDEESMETTPGSPSGEMS